MIETNVVLTKSSVIGIQQLLSSTDKDNETVVLSILEECNHVESLPWLLMIYREMTIELQKELSGKAPTLTNFLSNHIEVGKTLSISDTYDKLKKIPGTEAVTEYMIECFAKKMTDQLLNWGFQFMQEYDLIIKRKDDNTRQK